MYTPQNRERSTCFVVNEEGNQLFDFVLKKMGSMSKTAVKSLLVKGQILINDNAETKYNTPLHVGDKVKIDFVRGTVGLKNSKLSVLYEDDFLIVVNKSEGLLSVATDKNEESTAFRLVMNYLKKQNKNNRLYIVHRLDRETSGVLVFAKSKEVQDFLMSNWQRIVKEKIYYALVEGHLEQKEGTIHTWLNEDPKSKKVYSCEFDNGGQESFTDYQVVQEYNRYSMVKVNLRTGRKNQIRVHLQSIGHPIVGDKKYGAVPSPIGRIGLHALRITLMHPVSKKMMTFEAPLPAKMANFK